MLPVAVARSSSEDSIIRYVLPVWWMTSCFHVTGPVGQKQRRRYVSWRSLGGGTGQVAVYDCFVINVAAYSQRQITTLFRSPVLSTVDLMFCACFFFLFFPTHFFRRLQTKFSKLFHMTWLYSKKKRCYADFIKMPPNKNEGRKPLNFAQSRV